MNFENKVKQLFDEHEVLLSLRNEPQEKGNGIITRYKHPILTAAHTPVFWRYDLDEKTNPYTLLTMALAFKSATGSNGISGSVYWSDPDYYVDGVGSSVLLDDAKNTELFNQLADGTYKAGTVGNLAEG